MGFCLQTMTAYPGIWTPREYDKHNTSDGLVKAKPSDFAIWLEAQPDGTKKLLVPEGKKAKRWIRMERKIYLNAEGKRVAADQPHQKVKKQRKVICVDPKSPNAGNIHNDDSRLLIYNKFCISFIARPFHIVFKTIYHVTLIETACILIKGIKEGQKADKVAKRVFRSLTDIVRTPVYGTAIMIVTLAGIIGAPFYPDFVYDIRAAIARLSRESTWGKRKDFFVELTPCMQPEVNIMEYTLNEQRRHENKHYEDASNPVLVALDNKHNYH